jgi:hypothetical protein
MIQQKKLSNREAEFYKRLPEVTREVETEAVE